MRGSGFRGFLVGLWVLVLGSFRVNGLRVWRLHQGSEVFS